MQALAELYVNGEWLDPVDGGRREIRCPADGSVVTVVSEGSRADTVKAIVAARRAFDDGPWPRTPERERGQLLARTADLMVRDRAAFARAEALDTGKRLVEAEYDVDDVVACFRYYAGVAGTDAGRVIDTGVPDAISRVVHEPVGVCGLITPWNYPLLQTSWKVAPALLAGNTFVLKPSELTPSTAILLMRALEEAGLPAGVANLVLGAGPEVGAPLSEHPGVDLVSFTGGVETGRRIMATAAQTVKKVALELGGKNPNIVFADADFETAVDYALTAVFLHSGQVCSAGARLLVQDSLHDRFVDEVVRRAELIRLGGPFDDGGRDRAADLRGAPGQDRRVRRGRDSPRAPSCGAAGPGHRGRPGPRGYFFRPTVLDECDTKMRVVQDESFGPVHDGGAFHRRGRRRPHRQRHDVRPGRGRLDPGRRHARSGSRCGCGTARSGSTTTTPTCRRPSGAASSSPVWGVSSDRPGWRSTARPNTSGRTSAREAQRWFSG